MTARASARPTAGPAKRAKAAARPAKRALAAARQEKRPIAKRTVARGGRSNGRLVTLRTNGQITLPAELRDRVGARTGDVFLAEVEDDVVVLRPKKLIDSSQAWFWTPEWQKGEREAAADIKAGRVKSFRSVEELIAELHR